MFVANKRAPFGITYIIYLINNEKPTLINGHEHVNVPLIEHAENTSRRLFDLCVEEGRSVRRKEEGGNDEYVRFKSGS